MSKDCSELKKIIEELITGIEENKNALVPYENNEAELSPVDDQNMETQEALYWMHGATELTEARELEQWLFVYPKPTQTEQSNAIDHYYDWSDHVLEDGIYLEFDCKDLHLPNNNENLENYINRLAHDVEINGPGKKRNKRALISFLAFLRNKFDPAEVAFIEHILPFKRYLCGGRISRRVQPYEYPISIEWAGAIIKQLANECAFGRTNAQHHAGEALALIWLCIACARIRWTRHLQHVYCIQPEALILNGKTTELLVPSLFDQCPVRIGSLITRFLKAIAKIPSQIPRTTIIQTPLSDLRKPLKRALKQVNFPTSLGEVTFKSFLHYPHIFGKDCRPGQVKRLK